jgi:hypothetical protein
MTCCDGYERLSEVAARCSKLHNKNVVDDLGVGKAEAAAGSVDECCEELGLGFTRV